MLRISCLTVSLILSAAAVMNFFTWDRAVALFPRATFDDRLSFICRPPIGVEGEPSPWMTKWRRRGFEMIGKDHPYLSGDLVTGQRSILDARSWVIPASATKVLSLSCGKRKNTCNANIQFTVALDDSPSGEFGGAGPSVCIRNIPASPMELPEVPIPQDLLEGEEEIDDIEYAASVANEEWDVSSALLHV
ncbi:hypothetical protein PLICRDRAFT_176939 [Plicaturopsis crispa FD-325 SS-3]|nr:hypothetical protein PLICRDRAFT_176939 [Plicaturopsis crispa FD-325 SS-3]